METEELAAMVPEVPQQRKALTKIHRLYSRSLDRRELHGKAFDDEQVVPVDHM